MFEYLDTLSDDKRNREIILCISKPLRHGLYYLSDYLIPRILSESITKNTILNFIADLFTNGYVNVLTPGCTQFITRLMIDDIFSHDELISFFDDMKSKVSYKDEGETTILIVDRYIPDECLRDLPIQTRYGKTGVSVPTTYFNTVICIDICKLVLSAVLGDDAIDIAKMIWLIYPTYSGVLALLATPIALVSEDRTRELIKFIVENEECEDCFRVSVPKGYVTKEQLMVERIVISECNKQLSEYDVVKLVPYREALSRYRYLHKNRVAEV